MRGHEGTPEEMEVRELLACARQASEEGDELLRRLTTFDLLIENASGRGDLRLTGLPRGQGLCPDPTASAAAAREWYQAQKARLVKRLHALRESEARLDTLMEDLPALAARLLRLRWRERLSWTAISMRLHLSERQAQRVQKDAIARMAEALRRARDRGEPA